MLYRVEKGKIERVVQNKSESDQKWIYVFFNFEDQAPKVVGKRGSEVLIILYTRVH